jgi:hypothetical protein
MSISPSADKLLQVFLAAYPASAQMRGGRKLRRSNWADVFPGISSSVEEKEQFLEAVDELSARGIVSVKWRPHRRGDEVDAIYLENPEEMHRILGVPSPEENARSCLRVLETWTPRFEYGASVRAWLLQRIEERTDLLERLAFFITDLPNMLDLSPSESRELPIRALSGRLFGDTKRIESIMPDIDRICRSSLGENLSSLLDLSRSYPQTALRGIFTITFHDGRKWDSAGDVIYLDDIAAKQINVISSKLDSGKLGRVLIVENKETFMTLPLGRLGFNFTLYGGGHPNRAVQKSLEHLKASGMELCYFGDLDPEGLLIYQEFSHVCGGALLPWMMDLNVYRKYLPFGRGVTGEQLSRLSRLAPDILPDLANVIRETGMGVEQEVIDLQADH